MKIGGLVKEYRRIKGLSMQEFADFAGLSKGYISMLEKGRHPQNNREIVPSIETVQKIAIAMGLSIDELLKYVDNNQRINISHDNEEYFDDYLPPNILTPAAHAVPILGTICAGNGIFCEESFAGYFFLDKNIKADYCVLVKGDSMVDACIYDGDYAFLQKDFEFHDGGIYAVLWGAEEQASLKKVYKVDNQCLLQPCNKDYEAVIVPNDEVMVIGECIGTYHSR